MGALQHCYRDATVMNRIRFVLETKALNYSCAKFGNGCDGFPAARVLRGNGRKAIKKELSR
jgi:hypothetical protein